MHAGTLVSRDRDIGSYNTLLTTLRCYKVYSVVIVSLYSRVIVS